MSVGTYSFRAVVFSVVCPNWQKMQSREHVL
jgi:hypothetical protein